MTKKLDGYTAEPISKEEKADLQSAQIEKDELEAPELKADPEVVVATGDEDNPVAGTDHDDAMKTLYAKGRRNRELTMRKDAEGTPDVDMIQRMMAEASGGETDAAEGLDTNRGMDDAERQELLAIELAEEAEAGIEAIPEEEIVNDDAPKAPESLTEGDPDAKVEVKILGKAYTVPQQDIDDAGGQELYQKSRSANIKLQRIATRERALDAREQAVTVTEAQPEPDPSEDGLGEADIDASRDALLDLVIGDGTKEEINEWIQGQRDAAVASAKVSTIPPPTPTPEVIESPTLTETQAELQRQFEDDRHETNDMMRSQYSDIMDDPELQGLAQQRFNMLATRDDSAGRSQKEMARESAEYVRSLGRRVLGDPAPAPSKSEVERRTRVIRKRVMPQSSRAVAPAPDNRPKEKTVPTGAEHIQRLRRHAAQEPPL